MTLDLTATIIFVALFLFVTWLGFVAARWRKADLNLLHEWGLGGRRFGTMVTWFLLGGDLYTAYTFIAVPALVFGKGAMGFFNPDDDIYVPLATAQMRVMGVDLLRSIGVQAHGDESLDAVMAETDQILRRAHRLRPGEEADFTVRLVASAMVGDALIGDVLTRLAGLTDGPAVEKRFRTWLARLLDERYRAMVAAPKKPRRG